LFIESIKKSDTVWTNVIINWEGIAKLDQQNEEKEPNNTNNTFLELFKKIANNSQNNSNNGNSPITYIKTDDENNKKIDDFDIKNKNSKFAQELGNTIISIIPEPPKDTDNSNNTIFEEDLEEELVEDKETQEDDENL